MINQMKNLGCFFHNLISRGINEKSSVDDKLMLKTINSSSISLVFIYTIVAIFNFLLDTYLNAFLFLILACSILLNFFWLKAEKLFYAKVILIYPIFFVPLINILFQGYIPNHQYLGFIAITILGIYLSTIIFDLNTERNIYWFTIISIFLYACFYDIIFIAISVKEPEISFLTDNYATFKTSHLLLILITTCLLYYLKNLLLMYQRTIRQQHELLQKVNEALEEQINEKTKSIEASKGRIAELAFLTSHKVRGPLSSILGITKIINDEGSYKLVKDVLPNLYRRAELMDRVIKEMNSKIQDELLNK